MHPFVRHDGEFGKPLPISTSSNGRRGNLCWTLPPESVYTQTIDTLSLFLSKLVLIPNTEKWQMYVNTKHCIMRFRTTNSDAFFE